MTTRPEAIARLIAVHSVRRLHRERWRAALLVAAVALGVAVLVAVLYASDASVRSFRSSVASLGGGTSAEIRSRGGAFSVSELYPLYGALRTRFETVPFWEGRGIARGRTLNIIAVVPFELGAHSESPPVGESPPLYLPPDLLRLLEVEEGDELGVTLDGTPIDFKVSAPPTALESVLTGGVAITATNALPFEITRGAVSAVKLIPREGTDTEEFSGIAMLLHGAAQARFFLANPQERSKQAERLFEAFRLNIGVLVGMTMLVSAFVVFGASQLSVIALQRELGVLRTLGFSRTMLGCMILGEAAILGALGTLVGLTLGRPVTEWGAQLFLKSVAVLYAGGTAPSDLWGLSLAQVVPLAFVAGVSLCLLGAALPALRAARIPPGLVSRSGSLAVPWRLPRYTSAALGATALGTMCALQALTTGNPLWAHLSAFATVGALVAASWPLLAATTRRIRPYLAARLGVAGLLAAANVSAGVRIVGVATAASGVGLALLIGLGLMVSSFRATLAEWIDYTIRADLFVRSVEIGTIDRPARLPDSFEDEVSRVGDIVGVVRFAAFDFSTESGPLTVGGHDFSDHPAARVFRILRGVLDRAELARSNGVVISEAASRKLNAGVGDTVVVGGISARVQAIYKDYSSEHGVVLFDLARFRDLFGPVALSSAAIHVSHPSRIESVFAALQNLPIGRELKIQRNYELRATIFSIFDQTFQITDLMRLIVMVICSLGFILTVVQLHSERRYEIRTLTTLGLSRQGIRLGVLIEGLLIILPALMLGVVGGTVLALILIHLVNPFSFGWTLTFTPQIMGYVGPITVVLGSTAVAAGMVALRSEYRRKEIEKDEE